MALDDFADPRVGIAAAATATLMSPRARNVLRRGVVYGVAGAMKAADAVSSAAKNVAQEAQATTGSDGAPQAGRRTRAARAESS